MAEFTIDGKSKVLLSNQTQPCIILVDGETGVIEGPIYQHDAQRATRMCIDKSTMELYFIDVCTRPVKIQVLTLTSITHYVLYFSRPENVHTKFQWLLSGCHIDTIIINMHGEIFHSSR